MEKEIEKAIRETLVIKNPESIKYAVKKILSLPFPVSLEERREATVCKNYYPQNKNNACINCGRTWTHHFGKVEN